MVVFVMTGTIGGWLLVLGAGDDEGHHRLTPLATNKNRRAHNIIEEKGLDIDFKAITFTTFGGFGEGTHELIKEVTKDTDWSLNDPWVKPNPKSHAYLTFGFALARANARMLLHADSRRRSAKNRVRTTRPQSATS